MIPYSVNKKVIALLHADYEEPLFIKDWLSMHNIPYQEVRICKSEPFIDPESVLMLVIMGGPMNIYEYEQYPWLKEERDYIRKILSGNIPALGICLGAQLLADVSGGTVTRLNEPEFGWYTLSRAFTPTDLKHKELFPDSLTAFQWHQDTFSLPPGAIHLYASESCSNQGFLLNDSIIGLQFHPEMQDKSIIGFLDQVEKDTSISESSYPKSDIINKISIYREGNEFISGVVRYLLSKAGVSIG